MVTMAMIDAAREKANAALEAYRRVDDRALLLPLRLAREEVERLLREWWDQDCRSRDDGGWVGISKLRYAQLTEAEARLQTVEHSARTACGYGEGVPPSNGNWVDEFIGLLRVAREQRDDAAKVADAAEKKALRLEQAIKLMQTPGWEDPFDKAIIGRADHLLKRPRCACELHELPAAGYVDDDLGHHKAKRCNLTVHDRPGYIPMFRVVRVDEGGKPVVEKQPTCGNCRDWAMGSNGFRARCRLYEAPHDASDVACHRFSPR